MRPMKSPVLRMICAGLVVLFVMTSAIAAYAQVVHEPGSAPIAPYTDVRATSTIPYFSVVHEPYGVPYAPYTDVKATSTIPYWSVVHYPYD